MQDTRRKGLSYSAALHLLVLVIAFFGLPSFLEPTPPPQPLVVAVDILPISELTNVKNSPLPLAKEEKPEPEQEEAKKPTPPVKPDTPPPPAPKPEAKPEPKPEPAPKPIEKKEEKKEEKKPEPKPEPKKEEKTKKAKEEDLEAVLKSLKNDSAKKENPDAKKEKKKEDAGTKVKAQNAPYDASIPLSMTEMDAIRSQIAKCWSVPAGAKDAQNLQVTIRVQLQQDGTVVSVELADASVSRYSSGDSFFRAAAESAMRAVRQCSPLKNLPADKYQTWKDIIMTFDPKEMLF